MVNRCKRSGIVNLGGTQKVDFLGTCCGGHGFEFLGNDILWGEGFSITGLMQAITSDGKSGRYPKRRLFGYLLWW